VTPTPPDSLIQHLKNGRCALFVGAGLSAAAKLPTWTALLRDLIAEIQREYPDEHEREELNRMLDQGKLLEVAEYAREKLNEQHFGRFLAERVRGDTVELPAVHQLLPKLPFSSVFTTNYDKLLERAYPSATRVSTHVDTEDLGSRLFDESFFVLKAHGDIDRIATVVLTASDYRRLIHENAAFSQVFSTLLMTKAFLFVGYSLSDPDFRLLLDRQLSLFRGAVPARYALMKDVGEIEAHVLLRTSGIRVLSYSDHSEVPLFFQSLLEKLAAAAPAPAPSPSPSPAPLPTPTPKVAPVVELRPFESETFIKSVKEAEGVDLARLLAQPNLEQERALRAHYGDNEFIETRRGALQISDNKKSGSGKKGTVILIPGVMASELSVFRDGVRAETIWMNVARLALGGFSSLKLGPDGQGAENDIRPTGILGQYFADLLRTLRPEWDLHVFAYDWRKDFRVSARELRDLIEARGPVCHLLASSSGGVLARAFIREHRDVWDKMWSDDSGLPGRAGGRLVMLGCPNHGSFNFAPILAGLDPFIKKLGLLSLQETAADIRRTANTFPAFYQMLPSPGLDPALEALYQAATWGDIPVSQRHLDNARNFHRQLAEVVDPERMIQINGDNQPTITGIRDLRHLESMDSYVNTTDGDGTVAHRCTGLSSPAGTMRTYFVEESHGALPSNARVIAALSELLETGVSYDLSPSPVRPVAHDLSPNAPAS
jgi:hypothetical protein